MKYLYTGILALLEAANLLLNVKQALTSKAKANLLTCPHESRQPERRILPSKRFERRDTLNFDIG